jgi:hypothetical protein
MIVGIVLGVILSTRQSERLTTLGDAVAEG